MVLGGGQFLISEVPLYATNIIFKDLDGGYHLSEGISHLQHLQDDACSSFLRPGQISACFSWRVAPDR